MSAENQNTPEPTPGEPPVDLLSMLKEVQARLEVTESQASRAHAQATVALEVSTEAKTSAGDALEAAIEAAEGRQSAMGTVMNALLWSGTAFLATLALSAVLEKLDSRTTPTLRRLDEEPAQQAEASQ